MSDEPITEFFKTVEALPERLGLPWLRVVVTQHELHDIVFHFEGPEHLAVRSKSFSASDLRYVHSTSVAVPEAISQLRAAHQWCEDQKKKVAKPTVCPRPPLAPQLRYRSIDDMEADENENSTKRAVRPGQLGYENRKRKKK